MTASQGTSSGEPRPPARDGAVRLLLTTGTAARQSGDDPLATLLTTSFGFQKRPNLDLGDSAEEIQAALRDLTGEDLVVAVRAHGSIVEDELFLRPDTDDDPEQPGVPAGQLVRWLAAAPPRRIAMLLEMRGDPDTAVAARRAIPAWLRGADNRDGTVLEIVLTTTAPSDGGGPDEFAARFARAADLPASGGPAQPALTLAGIVRTLAADLPLPPAAPLTVTYHRLGPTDAVGLTLPNPRHLPGSAGQPVAGDPADRTEPVRLTGRATALAAVADWLAAGRGAPAVQVVTGGAGSGKSAVLGMLTDPDRASSGMARPDVTLDAKGRTEDEILARISDAAGAATGTVDALLAHLATRARPLTILVDGVDEAVDPPELVRAVLLPLAVYGGGAVRMLLGARRELLPVLGDDAAVIDLDADPYADRETVRALVREQLARSGGPLAAAEPDVRARAAEAIVEATGPSFLTALIVAATASTAAANSATTPAVDDPRWRAGLPGDLAAAVSADLAARIGEEADRARALLLPLAYAQGAGLPWEDTWPALATALHPGARYGHDDLRWLCHTAGGYLVEDLSGDQSVYRLRHAALATVLRAGRDETADQQAITTALYARVPGTADGRPDWALAQPYVRAHLITHAAAVPDVDGLLTDAGFLMVAAHPAVVAALPAARSEPARAAADVYRRAEERLRTAPAGTHAAYLELAARSGGATALADAVAASGVPRPWSTRWVSWQVAVLHRPLTGHTGAVLCVAVGQRDGVDVAVTGADDRELRVWDLTSGEPIGPPLRGHTAGVTAVAVGRIDDRTVVVSGSDDRTVRLWDLGTGAPIGEPLTGHTGGVHALALGTWARRTWLVSVGHDGTVRRWDPRTGRPDGPPMTGHTGPVTALALGELDGSPIAVTGGHDTTVRVWDLAAGTALGKPISGHTAPVTAIAFETRDGVPTAVSASLDHTIRRWNVGTHSPVGTPLEGHAEAVTGVALAELDGYPVAISSSADRTLMLWDLTTGAAVGEPLTGHTRGVSAVAVGHVDGRPVAVSGAHDHTVRLWDSALERRVGRPFGGHTDSVMSLAARSIAGTPVVVSGSADHTVRVWDLTTGHPIGRPLTGHTGGVWSVATGDRDGRPVAVSAGADQRLRLWDLIAHEPIGEPLTGHTAWVWAVALTEVDGRLVAVSGGDDHSVRVWGLDDLTELHEGTGHSSGVTALAVGRLGDRPVAVSGGRDQNLRMWNLRTGRPSGEPLTGHARAVWAVVIGEVEGQPVVVSGAADQTLRVWDPTTGEALGLPMSGHRDTVTALALGELDGRPLAVSGSDDKTVRVWDLTTRKAVGKPLLGHDDGVRAVVVAERHGTPLIVSGGHDNTIRVWDLATGAPIDYTADSDAVRAVAIGDLHGTAVAVSGGTDHTVRVWELSTGRPVGSPFTGHTGAVTALALSEVDGRGVVVSAGPDETVRLWDLADGRPLAEPLTGHTGGVCCVAAGLADDRPVAVTGGQDRTVRRWDLATGHPLGEPLTRHTGAVSCVAVTQLEGGTVVVTGGQDRTVRRWDLASGQPLGEPLTGHTGAVTCLTLARFDGHLVAVTGDEEGTVRTWDLEAGLHRRRWSLRKEPPALHVPDLRFGAPVRGLAHLGEGRLVVAAGHALLLCRLGAEVEREIVLDTPPLSVAARDGWVVAGTERGVISLEVGDTGQR
ncbi:WD40 repeat protein [Krasilnikovia cinnamomea]|uniref:WD40 repeat protein n=1 Tax=Krasilnikovia cinnamomea TaxID=349313 RepID=A0A4Q7ZCG3_9ACTN|nr:WD40 repeat domain-containing protein [Krasilnikovia cinnamomea]RZU48342.1 WD40 repeat protein [Krasilnikovia cinnamomea]